MRVRTYIYGIVLLLVSATMTVRAEELPYLHEIGLQAGYAYYVGEAEPHIFASPGVTVGLHYRYKFTKRWAIQAKVSWEQINGYKSLWQERKPETDGRWTNDLINIDVMAEFNFLRFGASNEYDKRIKPYTPYIFLGLGGAFYGLEGTNLFAANWVSEVGQLIKDGKTGGMALYLPFGIGFKWKFSDCFGLNIAWQHNLYFADDIEAKKELNNTHNLNGSNIMNCDLTGQLTVGLVVEFGRAKKPCRICNY
ncbi:MAG: outer membrane beta-barrel protein [Paludibacteraceae bacterium]|nr:outer membrane beta-barrel protein [Paludibacteraceae bacterium]